MNNDIAVKDKDATITTVNGVVRIKESSIVDRLPISYSDFATHLSSFTNDGFLLRRAISKQVCFMSPIAENLDALATEFKPLGTIYDVGAGSGYLSSELLKRGVDVISYDLPISTYEYVAEYTDVLTTENVELDIIAGNPNAVILSWPDYDESFAFDVAKACLETSATLYYLGEGYGGCTGDDNFHNFLDDNFTRVDCDLNSTYLSYGGINDSWHKYIPNNRLPRPIEQLAHQPMVLPCR